MATPNPTIGPSQTSFLENLRRMIANSAIGHSLEEGLPKVSRALNLTPTETVNSPDLAAHRNQLLAPEYLSPKTGFTHGVLKSAGGLTTPENIELALAAPGIATALPKIATALGIGGIATGGVNTVRSIAKAIAQSKNNDNTGAAETMGESLPDAALTGLGVASVPSAAKNAGVGIRNLIAPEAGLDHISKITGLSPRDIFNTAKGHDVNLDAAQATGAVIPSVAKWLTEHSMLGAQAFEQNTEHNVGSLENWSQDILHKASPDDLTREEFGNRVKSALESHQQDLNSRAGDVFSDLDRNYKHVVPDQTDLVTQAQNIRDDGTDYFKKFPSLQKQVGSAWGVINDIAGKAKSTVPEGDKPTDPASWSDLHKLRSDLMNMTRSPEIVGSRAEGWLKQLTGSVDDTLTNASNGLSTDDQDRFREANQLYTQMKGTYDNPQSPFYHIIRAQDGLTAANSMATLKPELVGHFNNAMSDVRQPELSSQMQRQTLSRMISPAGGDSDLKNLNARLNRAQKEQLGGILSPDQMDDLTKLAQTSKIVHADINPSGTAKVLKRSAEAAGAGAGLIHAATLNPILAASGIAEAATPFALKYAADKSTDPQTVENLFAPRGSTPVNSFLPLSGLTMTDSTKPDKPTNDEPVSVTQQKPASISDEDAVLSKYGVAGVINSTAVPVDKGKPVVGRAGPLMDQTDEDAILAKYGEAVPNQD